MPGGLAPLKAALISAAFLFLAAGCAMSPESFGGSRRHVVDWAQERGFVARDIVAGKFRLLSLERFGQAVKQLTVYIEGDGAAWPTRHHPPRDPTPRKPFALAMANGDAGAVAYLGRPCQYLDESALANCSPEWWTGSRYGQEVADAFMLALDRLKLDSGATTLTLVGHSGGGVVATLLAARRSDVVSLVTVASPLDVAKWTTGHGVSPLAGSLDPMRDGGVLPRAVHWVGGKDDIVPPTVVESFVARRGGRIRIVESYDHECCWAREWARLIEESR